MNKKKQSTLSFREIEENEGIRLWFVLSRGRGFVCVFVVLMMLCCVLRKEEGEAFGLREVEAAGWEREIKLRLLKERGSFLSSYRENVYKTQSLAPNPNLY